MKGLIIVFFSCFLFYVSFAQDEILFNSGKTCKGKMMNITQEDVLISKWRGEKSNKLKKYPVSEVFMVKYEDGTKKLLYEQNEILGNYLTPTQMSKFIKGEQIAMGCYKPSLYIAGSFVVGLGAGFLPPIPMLGAAPWPTPLPYVFWIGNHRSKIKTEDKREIELLKDEYVMEGYQVHFKKKRVTNSVISGAIGMIVGVLFYETVFKGK